MNKTYCNMDYEKAYKEAIKRAKAMIEVAEKEEEVYKSAIIIFPELAESEDERIRKELLESFKYQQRESRTDKEWLNGIKLSEVVAWLEKQGKHKDYYTKQELIDMGFSFTLNGDIVTPNKMMEDMKKYLAWLEKQGERKSIFNADDWYVSKVDGKIHNIYNSGVEPKFKAGKNWSEEDEKCIDNCCLLIGSADNCYEKTFKDDCIHYLQNLKERIVKYMEE